MPPSTATRAFTLIELLIVVAIIAILAAIAVPNFLEAQARAKVSRVRADLRSLTTALQSYAVDWNRFPSGIDVNTAVTTNLTPGFAAIPRINRLVILTTPVAYMTSIPLDAWGDSEQPLSASADVTLDRVFLYYGLEYLQLGAVDRRPIAREQLREFGSGTLAALEANTLFFSLTSQGPDRDFDTYDAADQTTQILAPQEAVIQPYDPTNGTLSDGDLLRVPGSGE